MNVLYEFFHDFQVDGGDIVEDCLQLGLDGFVL